MCVFLGFGEQSVQYIGAFWNGWPQNSFPGMQGPLRHWPRDATANGKNIFLMSDSRKNFYGTVDEIFGV